MTDDLITWLRAQLDEDEQVAREASRRGEHGTPTGEHWHWVETERDQPVPPDPVTEEYVGEQADSTGRVALRSVEEYPTSMAYTLPHFVVSHAEEVPAVCGLHIARHDPARVLAEVDAKRLVLTMYDVSTEQEFRTEGWELMKLVVRCLALPYADRPGYREEWRP